MRETTTENGRVRGIPCGWPSITAYYGIPYAAPPVGERRFREPEPAADWEGVRDCARASAKCWQLGVGKGSFYEKEFYPVEEEMSEDCLYLNIWTPAQSADEKLPVLFWVHGGAFMTGYGHSAHFDGEHFARQGVILVTINYRLNVFGWLVDPELDKESAHGVSGNYGLLDQIAALRWVNRNIASFGGDPEKITIAGQSAGAACVQALLCSPLTKGLYRGAILQSGGGPAPFPDMNFLKLKDAEERSDLSALGVSNLKELRALGAAELLERWRKTMPTFAVQRTPVQDGYVLTDSVVNVIRNGESPAVPILIGYTGKENLAFARDRADLETIAVQSFGEEEAKRYLAHCPQDGPDFKQYQKDMATELLQSAAESYALLRERQGKGETYVYCLDRQLPGDDKGPFHAADLWYVFRTLLRAWRPWEAADHMLAYACNTYWANFVKYGTPNGDREPKLPEWTPYTKKTPESMHLDTECSMYQRARNARVVCRIEDLT